MALLDSLARRPVLINTLSVGIVLAAALFVVYDYRQPAPPPAGTRLYFSTDDGRTTFPDDAARVPPFDHDGTPAVRAYVYACGGGRPFVAYLERYTPAAAKRLLDDQHTGVPSADIEFVMAEGTEVKAPGAGEWVKRSSPAGRALLDVKCPDGGAGPPLLVLPDD